MNSSARPPSQQKTMVEIVAVSSDESGRRLDNFLNSRLHGLPRARLYQMLRKGEVRVNGGRVKQDYRLQTGDKVRIPPVWLEPPGETASISPASIERLRQKILHEDSHLLVLNKPAGMAVHSGSGIAYGVIDIMRAARPDIERLELVHRLDRETSGCLLLAKDAVTLRRLHDEFRAGSIHKHYTAL
ncbi:MAG: pseudouridine synthase, partial [Gammaproteobacteria bacterium]